MSSIAGQSAADAKGSYTNGRGSLDTRACRTQECIRSTTGRRPGNNSFSGGCYDRCEVICLDRYGRGQRQVCLEDGCCDRGRSWRDCEVVSAGSASKDLIMLQPTSRSDGHSSDRKLGRAKRLKWCIAGETLCSFVRPSRANWSRSGSTCQG